jgi:hypothetical protein
MDPNWRIQYILTTRRQRADLARAEQDMLLKQLKASRPAAIKPGRFYGFLSGLGALMVALGVRLQSRFDPEPISAGTFLSAEPGSLKTNNPC